MSLSVRLAWHLLNIFSGFDFFLVLFYFLDLLEVGNRFQHSLYCRIPKVRCKYATTDIQADDFNSLFLLNLCI